ncbi:hypothetical protein DEF23_17745 [Marinitenerispora sediminis]|uniref:Uncharacterized protein n=1 Tax=Marinitenerispora sediminis TaxID=1931232 RepID=A0A368T427_9ACTN|nr:hypothetical protein DEF28_20150 [Marinitenerispora sediminis]RCV53352.1 hypothetical protein DEF23_17745 [Marinitenerispora sediminis]RCV57564.1 hypothetical protein DEF24_15060 [Marinitenerispora sediminis]
MYAALRSHGVHRIYGAVHASVSVLSLPGGLTVWCRGGVFTWRGDSGDLVMFPAHEVQEVLRCLLAALNG